RNRTARIQAAFHRSENSDLGLMLWLYRPIHNHLQERLIRRKDFVTVRAKDIIDVSEKREATHVCRIGVKHSQNIAIQGTPLQLAVSPHVEFRHRFLVELEI